MRARTRLVAVVVVAAMLASTVLAALAMVVRRPAVAIPAEGPWAVYVAGDVSRASDCGSDVAVADWYMSADMPSSRAAFVLAADARRSDVERVLACVTGGVAAGATVSVHQVAEGPGVTGA